MATPTRQEVATQVADSAPLSDRGCTLEIGEATWAGRNMARRSHPISTRVRYTNGASGWYKDSPEGTLELLRRP